MALNAPLFTSTSDLHKEAMIPTIEEFIQNNANRFYDKLSTHKNNLVSNLGNYSQNSLPFRLVHKMSLVKKDWYRLVHKMPLMQISKKALLLSR